MNGRGSTEAHQQYSLIQDLFDSGAGYYTHEQLMQRFHYSKGDCGGLMKEGR